MRASMRITAGPANRPMAIAVMVANTARKVMKLNTRSGPTSCWKYCASHSSILMRLLCLFTDQMLHHAFLFHKARSFHQNGGIRGDERIDRLMQGIDVAAMFSTRTERVAGIARQLAHREQVLDAASARVSAYFNVKLPPFVTHFDHEAQNLQTRRGRLRQHVDGRTHRIRIGVVGVVDGQRTGARRLALPPSANRLE